MNFFNFLSREKKNPLILTVHGFGQKGHHEFDSLAASLKGAGYDVIQFDLFNPDDPKDVIVSDWIGRAEQAMKLALRQKRPVIVIGFSMGSVISSYLASIYPVEKLILVAPAFYPFDLETIQRHLYGAVSSSSSGPKKKKMTSEQNKAFLFVVSTFRSSLSHVDCPVLILHGMADELVPWKSSKKAWEMLRENPNKKMLFVEGGKHRMMYEEDTEKTVHRLILDELNEVL